MATKRAQLTRIRGFDRWRGGVDAKLDTIVGGIETLRRKLESQDDRLRKVEGGHNRLLGKVAGLVVFMSAIGVAIAQAVARSYFG